MLPSSALYRWYLAQAWLEHGRIDEAEEELARLSDAGGEYAHEAQDLLDKISGAR